GMVRSAQKTVLSKEDTKKRYRHPDETCDDRSFDSPYHTQVYLMGFKCFSSKTSSFGLISPAALLPLTRRANGKTNDAIAMTFLGSIEAGFDTPLRPSPHIALAGSPRAVALPIRALTNRRLSRSLCLRPFASRCAR